MTAITTSLARILPVHTHARAARKRGSGVAGTHVTLNPNVSNARDTAKLRALPKFQLARDLFYGTGIGQMRRPFPLLCGPIFGTMIRYGKRQENPRKHAKERQELAH
jgi:hypothetical protein